MRTLKQLGVAFVCAAIGICAWGQSTKPGLWEVTNKLEAGGNSHIAKHMEDAQKMMASMPPAQRKQMEEMLAKQGVNMSFGAGGATTIRVCITPEMASRPPVEQQKDCTYNFPARNGNSQRFSFQCTKPVGDGEGEITFKGTDDYGGKMKITSSEGGKKETMTMLTSGKFLGASCGSVKPMAAPRG